MRKLTIILVGSGLLAVGALIAWAAEAATIRITAEDLVMMVTLKDRTTLKVTDKPTKIEPGEHQVKDVSFYKQDVEKKVWEIRATNILRTLSTITVTPGQDKVIDAGPPLTVHCQLWQHDDQVSISVRVVGKYSEVYKPYAFCGKRKPEPPVLTLKDPQDNVIVKTPLSVGGGGTQSVYHWRYGDYRGPYKVEMEMDLGPFDWKLMLVGAPEIKEK